MKQDLAIERKHAMTHKGLPVELLFYEQDPEDHRGLNAGWVCHRVEACVLGDVIGYLKIEYVPSVTLDDAAILAENRHWRDKARELAQFKSFHMDRPKVAYVRTMHPYWDWDLETDWRRKGVATLLYTEGARWLARTKSLPLWASTLQQREAALAWKNMRAMGLPIVSRPVPWKTDTDVYVLDFRTSTADAAAA
jgi:hypothetical protein